MMQGEIKSAELVDDQIKCTVEFENGRTEEETIPRSVMPFRQLSDDAMEKIVRRLPGTPVQTASYGVPLQDEVFGRLSELQSAMNRYHETFE